MEGIDPKYKKTRYEMAKQALAGANMRLPDLGYNIGIYLLAPSWKAIYPVQKFDRAKITEALGQLPAKASGRTSFTESFKNLEGVLKGLPGRTVVFIFSDGGYLEVPGIDPGNRARELANKYNVCFVVIDYAEDPTGIQRVKDMGRANACTRVIPFDVFISNPYYSTGLLYYTKAGISVETTFKKKVKTMVVNNIYFDNDKFDLKPQEKNELDQLGKFLQDNPQAFVSLQGFCDSMGSGEFNMELSRHRAEAVADYLIKNFKLDPGRVVAMWYGEANPWPATAPRKAGQKTVAWRLLSVGCDANSLGRILTNGASGSLLLAVMLGFGAENLMARRPERSMPRYMPAWAVSIIRSRGAGDGRHGRRCARDARRHQGWFDRRRRVRQRGAACRRKERFLLQPRFRIGRIAGRW